MTKEAIQTFSYRISQASRSELVVILYDMADEYLEEAIRCSADEQRDNEQQLFAFHQGIHQCGRVIDQLIKGLDFRYDLSNQLLAIYIYLKKDLIKCDAQVDEEELLRVKEMLRKLRQSFYGVSKTDQSGPLMKNTQQIFSGLTYSSVGGSNEFAGNVEANRGFTV